MFTDLEMPRMHGYELIRELRFLPAFKELPIVVVSSRSGSKHQEQARTLGATEYLTKPFTPKTIESVLAALLQRRRAARGEGVEPGVDLTASASHASAALPDELCVMLDLGAVVCALPTRWVARLLLLEEARCSPASGGLLDVGGRHFAAWDLPRCSGSSWLREPGC